MSRDLVRACAIGRAATLRRGPGPAGVRADGLFAPAGWDTPTWAQATCGGRVPTCRANACGGRPAATSVSRPASAHGLRKSGLRVVSVERLGLELPMFDITTGTGDFIANGVISHNCFARKTHEWLE